MSNGHQPFLTDGGVENGTETCTSQCSASEYELTCNSGSIMGSIPDPDPSLNCQAIREPTPSNLLFYSLSVPQLIAHVPHAGAGPASTFVFTTQIGASKLPVSFSPVSRVTSKLPATALAPMVVSVIVPLRATWWLVVLH